MNLTKTIKSTITNRKELLDKNRNNFLILELENGESILVFAEYWTNPEAKNPEFWQDKSVRQKDKQISEKLYSQWINLNLVFFNIGVGVLAGMLATFYLTSDKAEKREAGEGIDDYALIQDFLYLTYREILQKENKILFKEKFQAWEGGPFLESVYRQMKDNFQEHESLDCLFEEFTNAISQELEAKPFVAELSQNLKLACREELEELLKMDHFHLIKSRYIKEKIENLVDNPYLDYNKICQIPLGQQPRLYGNLQKLKHTDYYLFKALILDPNHLIYNENNFAKLKKLTCLFSEHYIDIYNIEIPLPRSSFQLTKIQNIALSSARKNNKKKYQLMNYQKIKDSYVFHLTIAVLIGIVLADLTTKLVHMSEGRIELGSLGNLIKKYRQTRNPLNEQLNLNHETKQSEPSGLMKMVGQSLPFLPLLFEQFTGQKIPQMGGTMFEIQMTLQQILVNQQAFNQRLTMLENNATQQFTNLTQQVQSIKSVRLTHDRERKQIDYNLQQENESNKY
ncbi:39729_t:CDS:10 [Gigaspora margarita]|uniref:39729_t:CDS:1 n=1 Tax=Gigaspora margarita TaxID=4874 RepID=A0ABN7WB71_GIGMA|nr:39729_t:CDS:10 [Gigaspora margarita]